MTNSAQDSLIPYYVDLDGTIIRTDLVFESILSLLRKSPFYIFILPFWLLLGRPYFKRQIALRIDIDPRLLPYENEVVEFLKAEKQKGRKLILSTASDKLLAEKVATYVGCFDAVMGTEGKANIKGANKLAAIKQEMNGQPFCYIGNSSADLAVWKGSHEAVVVSSCERLVSKAQQLSKVTKIFSGPKPDIFSLLAAIRVHQWVKNLLIFVPVFFGHKFLDFSVDIKAIVAFLSFSFTASSVYILNDLLDLPTDRMSKSKSKRQFASGNLSISFGMLLAPLCLLLGIYAALQLNIRFMIVLSLYFVITLAYSLRLKKMMAVDIVILASLYALRILAGGEATDIIVSKWLLAFAIFFFFSLACIKRYSELFMLKKENIATSKGRGYRAEDLAGIAVCGASSAYLSILILALYISSPEVAVLYRENGRLWFLLPLFLFWSTRLWLLAQRGEVHEDPIVFALTDKISYFVGLAAMLLIFISV